MITAKDTSLLLISVLSCPRGIAKLMERFHSVETNCSLSTAEGSVGSCLSN